MSTDQLRLWKSIAINPIKWALHPDGDLGGGFWVVSDYSTFGEIADYGASQYELEMAVQIAMIRMREGRT